MAEFHTFGRGETDPTEMYYLKFGQTSYHIPGLDVDKELSPCDKLLYKKLGAWWGKIKTGVAAVVMIFAAVGIYYGIKELRK